MHRWTMLAHERYEGEHPAHGLWSINIRPSFEIRVTSAAAIEPGVCGIYRYWAEGRIVYIGRGDIRSRANSPERAEWGIEAIDYSVIEDIADQTKWETLWLDEYRNEHGALPLYNRIGGKHPTADDGAAGVAAAPDATSGN